MLASRRQGSGERPLLLLHGFLGAGRNLASLARTLARRQPDLLLYLPDLPGHGGSLPSADGAGFEAMSRELLSYLSTLESESPIDLAGHSFGARVALACLEREPSRVGRVAILDMTPGRLDARLADRMIEDLVAAPDHFADRASAEGFFRQRTHDEQIVAWLSMNLERLDGDRLGWRIDRQYLAQVHAATRRVDLWPVVEQHPDRVAVLRGGRSALLSAADLGRLERLEIPVTTLESSGHFLHVDAPEESARWLQGWANSAR